MRVTELERTADLAMSVDSRTYTKTEPNYGSWMISSNFLANGNSNDYNVPYPPRHGQNMNVLWVDLHASSLHVDDIGNNRHQYFDPDNP